MAYWQSKSKVTTGAHLLFLLVNLVYLLKSVSAAGNLNCPTLLSKIPNYCERVQCGNAVSKHGCPSKTIFVENFAFCGCICPSCVKYLETGEGPCVDTDSSEVVWTPDPDCDEKEGYCIVKVNTCLPGPGIQCNRNSRTCEPPILQNPPPNPETQECMHRKSLRQLNLVHWDPECEADGSFSPKQCKGSHYDGECFCVDRGGNRIFGREWRLKAENQTCECSRKTNELRKAGYTATFHCSSDGNFESLQCDTDSGVCYCVDPRTGKLNGAVVPQSQWKTLPCFTLNITDQHKDGKYLRKCESEFAASRQLIIAGKEHGMEIQLKPIECDFDGSFPPLRIVGSQTQCVFKNGTRIENYAKPNEADGSADCNCARDRQQYLPSFEKMFSGACEDRTGNFQSVYDFGSKSSCVDRDGYLFGVAAPSKFYCCLLNDGCSNELQKSCHEENLNPTGIKQCYKWQYKK